MQKYSCREERSWTWCCQVSGGPLGWIWVVGWQTLSSPGWLWTWAALDSDRSRSGGGLVSSRYRDIGDTYQRQALLERKDVLLSSQGAESQVLLIKDWFEWDFNLATPYIQPK